MAHEPKGQHWRGLGKGGNASPGNTDGPVQYGRPAVISHGGVQSVGTDSGSKPTGPQSGDNASANAKFNEATRGPKMRPNVVMVGGR